MYMDEGRMRNDSSSPHMSLLAKLQVLGWGCQPHHPRREVVWFPTSSSWWGCCAAALECSVWMGSLSLTRDSGSRLSPLGCAYSLSHKDALRPAPVLLSLWEGAEWVTPNQLLCNCFFFKSVWQQDAAWCRVRLVSAGILDSLSLADLKKRLGPNCNPCSGKGWAWGENRPQWNSFFEEVPAVTKS